jgi:hypothetical protein
MAFAGDAVDGLANLERVAAAEQQEDGLRVVRHQLHGPFFHGGRAHASRYGAALGRWAPRHLRAGRIARDPATAL